MAAWAIRRNAGLDKWCQKCGVSMDVHGAARSSRLGCGRHQVAVEDLDEIRRTSKTAMARVAERNGC